VTAELHARLEAEADAQIREAVDRAEARMRPDLLSIFDQVYAEPTAELAAQREELARYLAAAGDHPA